MLSNFHTKAETVKGDEVFQCVTVGVPVCKRVWENASAALSCGLCQSVCKLAFVTGAFLRSLMWPRPLSFPLTFILAPTLNFRENLHSSLILLLIYILESINRNQEFCTVKKRNLSEILQSSQGRTPAFWTWEWWGYQTTDGGELQR